MRFICYSPDGKQEMLISEQHFNKYKKPNGWTKEKPKAEPKPKLETKPKKAKKSDKDKY